MSEDVMDEVLDAEDVAKYLHTSRWMVWDYVRKNKIPCFHVGHSVYFRRSSLMAWIEKQEQASMAK